METKHVLASKTLWVNLLAVLAAVSGAFGLDLGLTHDAQAAIVGGALAVVNIALRFLTSKPLTVKKES